MHADISALLLESYRKRFLSYKELGEKAMLQLSDEQLHWKPDANSNSIAVIVKHMSGNMLSRFTDFLDSDGEKPWRERDAEFEESNWSKEELLEKWNLGWHCLMNALDSLKAEDLAKTVTIRSEPHSVVDALNRQLAHYPYHVGQIVYIAKALKGNDWNSLSIPKGSSQAFNDQMAKQQKRT